MSGSWVAGNSCAALSMATKVLKASLRSSRSETPVIVAVAAAAANQPAATPGGRTWGRSGTGV